MPNRAFSRFEIDSEDNLREHLRGGHSLEDHVIHAIDLRHVAGLDHAEVGNCLFLGCTFRDLEQRLALEARGAFVFPPLGDLPFNPYRHELYSAAELLEGYDGGGYVQTRDFRVYEYFDRSRNRPGGMTIRESLAQRLHDHAVDDALWEFVRTQGGRTIVGIMGGHGTSRTDTDYVKVVRLCRSLTRRGFLVATGGGPGIMEAGNLGAYIANFEDDAVVDAALEILAEAPDFDGGQPEGTPQYLNAIRSYIAAAYRCRAALGSAEFAARFRADGGPRKSLAVPTWFYGHEPTNLFCDYVAKYFSNGLREDVLLAISRGGVVFAPGSAGTLQEVFMDLAQNHYATFVDRSPMVFLDRTRFQPVYDLIVEFIDKRGMNGSYGDLVAIFDEPEDVVSFIEANPPREREQRVPLYELVAKK